MTPGQKATAAAVLERAADLIDEKGWVKRSYHRPDRGYCVLGAINEVTGENVDAALFVGADGNRARVLLREQIGQTNIIDWNDSVFRRKYQVTRALRAAARKARENQ